MKRSSFTQDVAAKSNSHPRTVCRRSLSNSLACKTADQQTAYKKNELCQNRRGLLQILRNHQPIQMEPTCFSIKSGSLFSQFPHFITCEIPICVPDGPARVRFYWYAVFFFLYLTALAFLLEWDKFQLESTCVSNNLLLQKTRRMFHCARRCF